MSDDPADDPHGVPAPGGQLLVMLLALLIAGAYALYLSVKGSGSGLVFGAGVVMFLVGAGGFAVLFLLPQWRARRREP